MALSDPHEWVGAAVCFPDTPGRDGKGVGEDRQGPSFLGPTRAPSLRGSPFTPGPGTGGASKGQGGRGPALSERGVGSRPSKPKSGGRTLKEIFRVLFHRSGLTSVAKHRPSKLKLERLAVRTKV